MRSPRKLGDILHRRIKEWSGQDITGQCNCEKWIRMLNRKGPRWARRHIGAIVKKLVREASQRRFWGYAVKAPGARFFIRTKIVMPSIVEAEDEQ